jgi:hypothetical protein
MPKSNPLGGAERKLCNEEQGKQLDSGFRRNDELEKTPSPPNPPLEGEG